MEEWRATLDGRIGDSTGPERLRYQKAWRANRKRKGHSVSPEGRLAAEEALPHEMLRVKLDRQAKDFVAMYVFAGVSAAAMENFMFFATFGVVRSMLCLATSAVARLYERCLCRAVFWAAFVVGCGV